MSFSHCKTPCPECPWRIGNKPGKFPRERYLALTNTAVDNAFPVFGCHMSKESHVVACAGFLLSQDARHNLSVRMNAAQGRIDMRQVTSGGAALYPNYFRLARANGVKTPELHMLRRDCR